MSVQGKSRKSASDRGSRRSRVSDIVTDSAPASLYNDQTDRDSLDRESIPPLPMKPPGSIETGSDPRLTGNSAEEYFNDITTTPSDETPPPPQTTTGSNVLSRRRTSSSQGLSYSQSPSRGRSSRHARTHSSARDILRVLLSAESSQSREALALLRRVQERLEAESHRAGDAERRVQEANERWRMINQARVEAREEARKASEELRLYKLQLEAAQQQIARANDMIALTEKERTQAEDEAAKAKRSAKKLEMEREIQRARDDGRREGLLQGRKEAREAAEYGARYSPRDTYDRDRYRYRRRDRGFDEQTYPDDDELTYFNIDDDEYTDQAREIPVAQQPVNMREQIPRSTPPNVPSGQIRSTDSRGQRRSGGLLNTISRLGRVGSGRRQPGMDRNVAVNPSNAPDVATIVDEPPMNTLASPLPPEQTAQINRATPARMPEPDFDLDPSELRPLAITGAPRSPAHPHTIIPPDGWIPRQDEDGEIRLPPPHEMAQAPPTPRSQRSPLPNAGNLPPLADPELPERERGPIQRDYAQQPRSHGRHRYQKSVADSEDSVATGNLSILSPPGARPSAQPRLSAIPEHDPRYASPSGSMRQSEVPLYATSPRPRSVRDAEEVMYIPGDPTLDPALANRRSMVNEGPVRPMDMAFSPRSNPSHFSGPKRPSHITMPAPLAPDSASQRYTRPRINSVASGSENSGFIGTPRFSRSRDKTPAPDFNRSRVGTAANTPVATALPEINIVPASHFESSQSHSNPNALPEPHVISPRRTQSHNAHTLPLVPGIVPMPQPPMPQVPEPPSPANIPGMPKGFIPTPTSPMPAVPPPMPLSDPIPNGFPASPFVAPPGAPPGFVPTSPAVPPQGPSLPPDAPPGFVPTSPAVVPGAPPGFVPTSPAVHPVLPPVAVPLSPAVPDGAPPGFMPASPVPPEGAPLGFVPTSTQMLVNPLPQPSPAMSTTGALPVLARSESEAGRVPTVMRAGSGTTRSPRVSFSGPNVGFNSRAASEWDTQSAWGNIPSEQQSPRPVRGPDLSATIVRPGSPLSRRDPSPVIPDAASFRPSRRSSRDPIGVPLPTSTAPSLARSGRASSHAESRERAMGPGVTRSQSARSETSRGRIYGPGTPARPSVSGLPPSGLESPYSRRLDPHLEDEDEYEIVPSEDSNNTLTTPPGTRRDLPPPGSTPMVPVRNAFITRSPAASQRGVSLSAAVDAMDDPEPGPSLRRSASRQSIGSNKSYARYDPNEYVDPAVLTSGRSRLLDLPQEEPASTSGPAGGKKNKAKRNKGKKR